jgi:ring-1,2-phenylacetyl-CoA epoxidase subunit PaaE
MSHFHLLRISTLEHDTREAIVLQFEVPAALREAFRYAPGQHLTLRQTIAGEELRRSYSICAAVQEQALRVAVKRVPGGAFSEWAHRELKVGTTLDVMPPEGRFHHASQSDSAGHQIAFAAGSGITPILSIIKTTLQADPDARFTLVYGNRASSTVMFREELAALKDRFLDRFNLIHVLSREHQDVDLFNGRITGEKVRQLLARWLPIDDVDQAYLCGPQAMTAEVREALQAAGLARERIHVELFATSHPIVRRRVATQATTAGCEVRLVMDGTQRVFSMPRDGSVSLLDAALQAGIDVRHACKGGVCATCRCRLVEGEVDMDANYALEDYEIARGFRLSCQSFPASDHLVVDFDTDH